MSGVCHNGILRLFSSRNGNIKMMKIYFYFLDTGFNSIVLVPEGRFEIQAKNKDTSFESCKHLHWKEWGNGAGL